MPLFEGTDPDGWILRIERYFNFYRLSEAEKLEAVLVTLEGDALRWFQWENKRRPIRRWDELREFMLRQFRPSSGGLLCEQWLATTQTSKLRWSSGQYSSVSFRSPNSGSSTTYSLESSPNSIRSWATQAGESSSTVSSPKSSTQSSLGKVRGGMRRLTDKELQEKRAKGLCFRCDEKWSIGHRCKRRELSILLIEEEEEERTEYTGSEPPMSPTNELINEVITQPEVSLNSWIVESENNEDEGY